MPWECRPKLWMKTQVVKSGQLHRYPQRASRRMFLASYSSSCSPLKAWARLFSPLYEALMCEALLWGKAKQTGWPRHKESATQRHVAAKPSQSPPSPIQLWTPYTPTGATQTIPHSLSLEPREGKMEEEGEQILISIHWMSPPHKGDHMTLPLNQS